MGCCLRARSGGRGGADEHQEQEYAEDQGPIDAGCGCMVCRRYSRAYLRHLFAAGEPLGATLNSIHNLAFYLETMDAGAGGAGGYSPPPRSKRKVSEFIEISIFMSVKYSWQMGYG